MGLLKRLLIIVLTASLTISVVSAEESPLLPEDVYGLYKKTAEKLSALGVVDNIDTTNEALSAEITRGEFVHLLCATLGYRQVPQGYEYTFNDVLPGYQYAGDINTAFHAGILHGQDDGEFEPERVILVQEAVKMVVTALNYDIFVKNNGGYPNGYLAQATQIGLFKNMKIAATNRLKKGDALQLLGNAVEVDLYQETGFGEDFEYQKKKGVNLLSERLDIYKIEGQITANGVTALTPIEEKTGRNFIRINGDIYDVGNSDAGRYLGYNVILYVKKISSQTVGTVLYVESKMKADEVLEIDAENIKETTTIGRIEYYEDGRVNEAKLLSTADLIYNSVARSLNSDLYLKPERGKLVLLDTDGDGIFDIVFVTSYITYVVDSVNKTSGTVTDKFSQPALTLDHADTQLNVNIIRDGKRISVNELVEWEVLSVAADAEIISDDGTRRVDTANARYLDIISSSLTEIGVLQEISEDTVKISGAEYKISKYYKYLIKNQLLSRFTSGNLLSFYFNHDKELVAIDAEGLDMAKYGYLIEVRKDAGIENHLSMKVLESSGEVSVLTFADKVKLDGTAGVPAVNASGAAGERDVYTALTSGGKVVRQVIGYAKNAQGLVCMLDTVAEDSGGNSSSSLTKYGSLYSNIGYKSSDRAIGEQFILDPAATIFSVPALTATETEWEDERNYKVEKASKIQNDQKLTFEAYNVKRVKLLNLMVLYGGIGSGLTADIYVSVIEKVTSVIDKDDIQVKRIIHMKDGKMLQADMSSDGVTIRDYKTGSIITDTDCLGPGDIIRYGLNSAGKINEIEMVVDADNYRLYDNSKSHGIESRTVYGLVYDLYNNVVELMFDEDKLNDLPRPSTVYNMKNVPIMMYDGDSKKVRLATQQDIITYKSTKDVSKTTRMAVNARYGEVRAIVIYNNMK